MLEDRELLAPRLRVFAVLCVQRQTLTVELQPSSQTAFRKQNSSICTAHPKWAADFTCYEVASAERFRHDSHRHGRVANTQVYILDSHSQPTAIGVPGEIFIGGEGLARGYLNRPDMTCGKTSFRSSIL